MFTKISNYAKAHIKGGKKYPAINGIVSFRETKNGVFVTAKINGLPQSNSHCSSRFFGFHIHEGTSCTGNASDEFANAKLHLNLTDCPHPFHSGDLPPLIENNGYAYMRVLISKFKIKDILGKVVIIHDSPDDFTTQPSRKFWYKDSLRYNSALMLSIKKYRIFFLCNSLLRTVCNCITDGKLVGPPELLLHKKYTIFQGLLYNKYTANDCVINIDENSNVTEKYFKILIQSNEGCSRRA